MAGNRRRRRPSTPEPILQLRATACPMCAEPCCHQPAQQSEPPEPATSKHALTAAPIEDNASLRFGQSTVPRGHHRAAGYRAFAHSVRCGTLVARPGENIIGQQQEDRARIGMLHRGPSRLAIPFTRVLKHAKHSAGAEQGVWVTSARASRRSRVPPGSTTGSAGLSRPGLWLSRLRTPRR